MPTEGRAGVLLADGSVPKPVYLDSNSGGGGCEVCHWSVYDGAGPCTTAPKTDALHAECSCGLRLWVRSCGDCESNS